jgi:hypothetical protein
VVGAVCGHPSMCGKLKRKGHTPLSLWEKNDIGIHQEIYLFIYCLLTLVFLQVLETGFHAQGGGIKHKAL